MNEKPLRLIIFGLLYLIDVILSIPYFLGVIAKRIELLPPEALFWINLSYGAFVLALLMLLICVWLENRIAYIVALLFVGFEVAWFFIVFPNYKLIYFILETIQLALLLSLFKHFFKR